MSEVEDSAECPNCGEHVAPEQDADLIFYPCNCGMEFGYRRIPQAEDTCAAGIPLRHLTTDRVFQAQLLQSNTPSSVETGPPETAVFLGNVIPVRPGDN